MPSVSPPGVISAVSLASRFLRLIAFIIDSSLAVGLMTLIYLPILFGFSGMELPGDAAMQMQDFGKYLPVVAVIAVIFFVVQIILLSARGQTIGKFLLRMKIVKKDTMRNGGFVTNVIIRECVNGVAGLILPLLVLWLLIDSLFIFRGDRRCLHDLMAGTIVIKA